MRLVQKLILILFLISIIPIFCIVTYGFSVAKIFLEQQVVDGLTLNTELAEGHIFAFLDRQRTRTIDWATDWEARDLTTRTKEGDEAAQEALNNHLATEQQYDKSMVLSEVVDLDGVIIASTNRDRIGKSWQEKIDLTELARLGAYDAVMSEFEVEEYAGDLPVFHIYAPVVSVANGANIAILVTHTSVNDLEKILSGEWQEERGAQSGSLGRPETFEMLLINKETGAVVASSKSDLLEHVADESVVAPVVACREETQEFIGSYLDGNGHKVYGAAMCPLNQWWVLITKVDEAEALALVYSLRRTAVGLAFFGSLLSILVAILFGRRLVEKIKRILSGLDAVGKGDFSNQILIKGKDEIAQIARRVNEAALSLGALTGKLRTSESKFRNLIESSPDCIKVLDSKGKLLMLNRGGMQEHGFKNAKDWVGWDYLQAIDKKFVPHIQKALQAALAGEVTALDVKHLQDPKIKGSPNREWCNMTFAPLRNDTDKVENILVISRDITESKQFEQRQRELDDLKNRFIQVVSHQVRTPLNVIRWNLEMILGNEAGKLNEGQEEILRASYNADKEVILRIGDLVTALDIEEGKLYLNKSESSVTELLRSAVADAASLCRLKNINCEVHYPENDPLTLLVDGARVRDCFRKLLDNAATYTKEGGRLEVKLEKNEEDIYFEVKDSGIGIPKSEHKNVFTRFFRASNSFSLKEDASGLGLYLVKNFVEAHGGTVGFESEEEKGSIFWFRLPL